MDNNLGRRRIQVGLLVSHLDDDFDISVCEGATIAAKELDVNLVVFPGRYIDGVYADKLRTEYEYQYNTIFDIPCYNKFDILLVLVGTIGSHLNKDSKKKFLKRFDGTPVITITSNVEGYRCISIDNKTGMDEVITHLIEVHGCRRIGYVSGPSTSDDANERLEVYRDVLRRNGLDYVEDRVVYGNFSKYVGDKVEELLDRCPDLDAIVFANDQMAIAGYEVMEKRGLKPGKDICVTGFDDDPAAMELTPHLTTVKADPVELGYNALLEAMNYVTNGVMDTTMISSVMVQRSSCGCGTNAGLKENAQSGETVLDTEHLFDEINSFLFAGHKNNEATKKLKRDFAQLMTEMNELATEENIGNTLMRDKILSTADAMTSGSFFGCISIDKVYSGLEFAHKYLIKRLEKPEDHLAFSQVFISLYRIIAEKNFAYCSSILDDNYFMSWQTNSITRDMLVFDVYDDQCYFSVVDKLQRLHMTASYLYAYDPSIVNKKTDTWKYPAELYLKAYHDGEHAEQLPAEKQAIKNTDLFTNPYIPKDRQYTLVVVPLFSNEEHYGLLMCEIEHQYFNYIQSAAVQLCAALKIIALMKQQAVTQRQLKQSLIEVRENNQLLSELSKTDELTGCLNRRGFYEEVRKKLRDETDNTALAFMVFADLDYLKTINDRFGHEEGDFAIRSAVDILRRSFRRDETIGRLGGDEFVVCAFVNGNVSIKEIRERIETSCIEFNEENTVDKPYLVHISVGVYPFRCTDTVEIGELLSHADALLYEQKKRKKPILKEEIRKLSEPSGK